jgi:hypothetical protein
MASYRLRSFDVTPRGGYFFQQNGHRFGPEPVIENMAKRVWGFRKGNNLPRATYREAMEDISIYQCSSRGNDPLYCIECNPGQSNDLPIMGDTPGLNGPCKGCGAKVS